MRHNKKKGMKLGTDAAHTKAMKRSLVRALFMNDRIKTIDVRAKAIRGDVDKIITWAKKGDIHSRRLAIAYLNDKEVVREVFEKAAQGMWADRNPSPRRPRLPRPPCPRLPPWPRPPRPRSRLPSRSPLPRRPPSKWFLFAKRAQGPWRLPGPFFVDVRGCVHEFVCAHAA